jgi:hypothetical protein
MRPSFTSLRKRVSDSAERADSSGVAAGEEPRPATDAAHPGARGRGAMRRRLRRLRRIRQAMLLELGAYVLELRRYGRLDGANVERKAVGVAAVDQEARTIADALDARRTLSEVVATGVSAPCASCGALLATRDRFCASCGASAGKGEAKPAATPAAPPATPAAPRAPAAPSAAPPTPAPAGQPLPPPPAEAAPLLPPTGAPEPAPPVPPQQPPEPVAVPDPTRRLETEGQRPKPLRVGGGIPDPTAPLHPARGRTEDERGAGDAKPAGEGDGAARAKPAADSDDTAETTQPSPQP